MDWKPQVRTVCTINILEWRLTRWNLLRNSLSHRKSCNVSNNHNYMAWQVDYLVTSVDSWLFLFFCIAMSKPYRYSKCLALHRRSNSCVKTILLSYETTRSCMGRYFTHFAWSFMNVLIFCWSTLKGGWRRCRADAQFITNAPNHVYYQQNNTSFAVKLGNDAFFPSLFFCREAIQREWRRNEQSS